MDVFSSRRFRLYRLEKKAVMFMFFKWAIPGLFFFISVFSLQLTVNKCSL